MNQELVSGLLRLPARDSSTPDNQERIRLGRAVLDVPIYRPYHGDRRREVQRSARVLIEVTLDLGLVLQAAERAANNKARLAKAGAVTVQVVGEEAAP